jgi:hypothetical protein
MAKKKAGSDGIKMKGFFRLNIVEDDPETGGKKVVGDSGWVQNQVTNLGFNYYLCELMGAGAASLRVGRMVIGNGTTPASNATTLPTEIQHVTSKNRVSATYSSSGSNTARWVATWASSDSHLSAATTVANLGLINNTTSGGTILCGKTFNSSAWGTNQDIYATYDIGFS